MKIKLVRNIHRYVSIDLFVFTFSNSGNAENSKTIPKYNKKILCLQKSFEPKIVAYE